MLARFTKYLRLLGALARYTLSREMAFRGNFLVKVSVEVLWLAILIAFYRTIFARTTMVAGWSAMQESEAKAKSAARVRIGRIVDEGSGAGKIAYR